MSRKDFARGYSTAVKYFREHKGKNYYEKYLRKLWNLNKDVQTLQELRSRTIRESDKSTIPYKKLSDEEKALSKRASLVQYRMKYGMSLKEAMKGVEISLQEVKQYLGKALYKKRGRYYTTMNDKRQRPMPFFENGKQVTIITTSFKDASTVGTYLNEVRYALDNQTEEPLKKYKGKYIVDADGKKRYFETDWDKLQDIRESKEEIEKGEGAGSHDEDEDF